MTYCISDQIQKRYFETNLLLGAILSIQKYEKEFHYLESGIETGEKTCLTMNHGEIYN
tara:strand:- start:2345 stop:2518 length:174 start_codon:yes stop_codon:yes gene_type:complete